MWSDNETINDLIGFNVHKDLIKSVVTSPDLLPVTMGVFGDWGSGKTSIMKMLEHDLNPDHYDDSQEKKSLENILCVYFNGWMFEGYDDAKAAILDEVLQQIKDHKKFGPKAKEKISSLMKSVDWMRMAQIGVKDVGVPALSAFLTGGLSLIPQLFNSGNGNKPEDSIDLSKLNIKKFIKNQEEVHMDVRTFRDRFAEMLQETEISSLVVLIDDLDRCSPERIIDNLEAIKLFLNVENTAFVIGADPRIVKHAIEVRYNTLELGRFDNGQSYNDSLINDYLEKLIQVPYHLPRMSPAEVETYMTLLFCKRDITNEKLFNKILEACKKQQSNNRYATFGYSSVMEVCDSKKLPARLVQSLISNSKISPLITEGLKGNPRQIKRFLNAYTLRKKLADVAYLENIRDDILVKLMVLEYTYRENFQQLFTWQSESDGFPEQIENLETALLKENGKTEPAELAKQVDSQWSNSFLIKWITMEPHLTNIDLRDYFWIARDKLSSTFTGLTMVSPIVRIVLDGLISGNEGKINQSLRKLRDLNIDEIEILLDLLSAHVIRNPAEIVGYKALRNLIDQGVEGSLTKLINTVFKCPPQDIPVAVAVDFMTLAKSKPELKSEMNTMINWLKENNKDKPIGRALEGWEGK